MGPQRIVVMTVSLGQPLADFQAWVQQRGFAKHIIQPLKTKSDYARRYEKLLVRIPPVSAPPIGATTEGSKPAAPPQTCRFLNQNLMRYYTCDSLALPCCFIKDTRGIESIAGLKAMLGQGQVPLGCAGCDELKPARPLLKVASIDL